MSTRATDVDVVRRVYEAFEAGDMVTVRSCFTDDAVWHFPGRSPLAGDYRGTDAIFRGFLGRIRELSGGTLAVDLLELFGGEGKVAALQRVTGERDGKQLDVLALQLFTLRDGRIAEVRGFQADQYALDDFWS